MKFKFFYFCIAINLITVTATALATTATSINEVKKMKKRIKTDELLLDKYPNSF